MPQNILEEIMVIPVMSFFLRLAEIEFADLELSKLRRKFKSIAQKFPVYAVPTAINSGNFSQ